MKKVILNSCMPIAAILACVTTLPINVEASPVDKVIVCHIPPGNPDNMHTIRIGEPAVSAHLAHGDSLDYCFGDDEDDVTEAGVHSGVTTLSSGKRIGVYTMRSIQGN